MDKQINRALNFNPGPTALPPEVLREAREQFMNYRNTGMSVMELSHRSAVYEEIHNGAIRRLRELLGISDEYKVLFLQGGASLQFGMIPLNFLGSGQYANYLLTGSWSEKAQKEANVVGETFVGGSSKENSYRNIPDRVKLFAEDRKPEYVHVTSNNTIYGTQWRKFPDTQDIPLVADMSSDILSRKIEVDKFSLIYAGAQKNLGPSGVTLVILHEKMLTKEKNETPNILKYSTHAKKNSLYHTPPTFSIYMLGLMAEWVQRQGGLEAVEKRNEWKASLIYDAIDESDGFYAGHAEENSRSLMNITFRLKSEALERQFLQEAKSYGFVGLNGHRSVGGCRVSLYNAVSPEQCETLRDFMDEFRRRNQ
ncbi:MAG TPA: 3-phosphoserine/phosphohydroxythreonine transaminase [Bacillales bacterium]|nr:3-phosphoserine/phosphohydroxythreonine transaminase [Bacillales bacterium]